MVPLEPFENKVFKPRRQVPGKRSLPGRPLEAQDPGKRILPGRPTRASQRTCRDAPRVPAGLGERQVPGRGKTTAATRHLPRRATTLYLRSSSPTYVSLRDPSWRTCVGERCRKLKFFLRFHQDPSRSSSSNEYSD